MTLSEIYNKQNQGNQSEIILRMPEVASLIKHLDLMYVKLLNQESEESEDSQEQPLVEILGKPYIQTRSWFNPGQGIKQSAVVE
tara:strand:- start:149 stop:400 length:252 start_codon:yes stop_codon:yes gene_type:complete